MDYAENIPEYKARFEFEIQKGKDMTAKYKLAYNRRVAEHNAAIATDPDMADINGNKVKPMIELTTNQEQTIAKVLGQIYRSAYGNSIDDIHVNNRVASTAEYSHDANAHPDSMKSEVRRLYKEVLFKRKSNQDKDTDGTPDGEFRSQYNLHDHDFAMPGYMQYTNDLLLSYGVNAAHNNVLTSHDAMEALA